MMTLTQNPSAPSKLQLSALKRLIRDMAMVSVSAALMLIALL